VLVLYLFFFSTEEAGDANKTLKNHKNKLYFQMKKNGERKKKEINKF